MSHHTTPHTVDAVVIGAGFGGIYSVHKLAQRTRPHRGRLRQGRRPRRHLVLEPLPGRAVRHGEPPVPLLLRPRPAGRRHMEEHLHHPARDPRIPRERRRTLRPGAATSASAPRSSRPSTSTTRVSGRSPPTTAPCIGPPMSSTRSDCCLPSTSRTCPVWRRSRARPSTPPPGPRARTSRAAASASSAPVPPASR